MADIMDVLALKKVIDTIPSEATRTALTTLVEFVDGLNHRLDALELGDGDIEEE